MTRLGIYGCQRNYKHNYGCRNSLFLLCSLFGTKPLAQTGSTLAGRASGAKAYNLLMARGWESKSIEAQQDEANHSPAAPKQRLTKEDEERIRKRERLRLSLENVRQQLGRSLDDRYRAVLKRAAEDLEKQIQQISE